MIAQEGAVTIRKMQQNEQDLQLFLKWMTDPETMKYWEGLTERFTYERVVEQYQEHVREQVEQCMMEYGQKTIGYCQFCMLNASCYEVPQIQYDQFVGRQDAAYGIDLFIGEVDWRSRGVGTECLKVLMKALFEKYHADVLLIDPKVHNARAIRCYHKCGFQDLFVAPQREWQDGIYHDSLIMGIKKADFVRSCIGNEGG